MMLILDETSPAPERMWQQQPPANNLNARSRQSSDCASSSSGSHENLAATIKRALSVSSSSFRSSLRTTITRSHSVGRPSNTASASRDHAHPESISLAEVRGGSESKPRAYRDARLPPTLKINTPSPHRLGRIEGVPGATTTAKRRSGGGGGGGSRDGLVSHSRGLSSAPALSSDAQGHLRVDERVDSKDCNNHDNDNDNDNDRTMTKTKTKTVAAAAIDDHRHTRLAEVLSTIPSSHPVAGAGSSSSSSRRHGPSHPPPDSDEGDGDDEYEDDAVGDARCAPSHPIQSRGSHTPNPNPNPSNNTRLRAAAAERRQKLQRLQRKLGETMIPLELIFPECAHALESWEGGNREEGLEARRRYLEDVLVPQLLALPVPAPPPARGSSTDVKLKKIVRARDSLVSLGPHKAKRRSSTTGGGVSKTSPDAEKAGSEKGGTTRVMGVELSRDVVDGKPDSELRKHKRTSAVSMLTISMPGAASSTSGSKRVPAPAVATTPPKTHPRGSGEALCVIMESPDHEHEHEHVGSEASHHQKDTATDRLAGVDVWRRSVAESTATMTPTPLSICITPAESEPVVEAEAETEAEAATVSLLTSIPTSCSSRSSASSLASSSFPSTPVSPTPGALTLTPTAFLQPPPPHFAFRRLSAPDPGMSVVAGSGIGYVSDIGGGKGRMLTASVEVFATTAAVPAKRRSLVTRKPPPIWVPELEGLGG